MPLPLGSSAHVPSPMPLLVSQMVYQKKKNRKSRRNAAALGSPVGHVEIMLTAQSPQRNVQVLSSKLPLVRGDMPLRLGSPGHYPGFESSRLRVQLSGTAPEILSSRDLRTPKILGLTLFW